MNIHLETKVGLRCRILFVLICCLCLTSCSGEVGIGNKSVQFEDTIQRSDETNPSKEETIQSKEKSIPVSISAQPTDISSEISDLSMEDDFVQNLYDFLDETSSIVFGSESDGNQIYAPMNFYLSLSMLSNMTDGEAQKEILNALQIEDITDDQEELYKALSLLQDQNQRGGRLNIKNSLWIKDSFHYRDEMLTAIKEQYMTEIYKGDFARREFQEKITDWVSENTNHEFIPSYDDLETNDSSDPTALIILNILDFNNEWVIPFKAEDTSKETFELTDGSELICDFMKMEEDSAPFFYGEDYTSTILCLKGSETMLFILPNEGVILDDFIAKNGKLKEIITNWTSGQFIMGEIKLWAPKFTYTGEVDLSFLTQAIGIEKIFDDSLNPFSAFAEETIFISSMKQTSKIAIDENGCSVASFTKLIGCGAGPRDGKAEIILNRPFIYVLYKEDIPFLIGMVRNPLE